MKAEIISLETARKIQNIKDENKKILKEIYDFCEECPSHDSCPEEECVLYRIENIVIEEKENEKENKLANDK